MRRARASGYPHICNTYEPATRRNWTKGSGRGRQLHTSNRRQQEETYRQRKHQQQLSISYTPSKFWLLGHETNMELDGPYERETDLTTPAIARAIWRKPIPHLFFRGPLGEKAVDEYHFYLVGNKTFTAKRKGTNRTGSQTVDSAREYGREREREQKIGRMGFAAQRATLTSDFPFSVFIWFFFPFFPLFSYLF